MRGCRLFICLVAVMLVVGCEAKTRYGVLNFFFDGVPNPEEKTMQIAEDKKNEQEGSLEKMRNFREHAPYAAKQCQSCHLRGSNKLLKPAEQLCLDCHQIDLKKRWVHGPVASGGCKMCHDPHKSMYPFLLVAEPKDFCLYCHDEKIIFAQEAHREMTAQCTMCHDAHSSDQEHMLK